MREEWAALRSVPGDARTPGARSVVASPPVGLCAPLAPLPARASPAAWASGNRFAPLALGSCTRGAHRLAGGRLSALQTVKFAPMGQAPALERLGWGLGKPPP